MADFENVTNRTLPQLDRRQRLEAGKAHRKVRPIEDLAELPQTDVRADPVGILRSQDEFRQQKLVPIRHGRMSATAFTFYRGGAAIMAADLAMTPRTDLDVQLCGDAHLSNFGLFNGADRSLIFDLNDFDETLPGPFEWDVKRLAASVAIAARNNDHSSKKVRAAATAAASAYKDIIERASVLNPLDLHYFRLGVEEIVTTVSGKSRKRADKQVKKATRKNSMRALDKLTEVVDGKRVIVSDPPLITKMDEEAKAARLPHLKAFLHAYLETLPLHRRLLLERYELVDLAHKVVGVGSVGTRCWILLLMTADGAPLFLQFKQATDSVLEPHVQPSRFEQAGERVVQGQRMMQASGDLFLGWSRFRVDDERTADFYFRQLWDGKGSADVDLMGPNRLRRYAAACGGALALAHARSADAAIISGYLGDSEAFDEAIADFSVGYADLNESDHTRHETAINSGQLEVIKDI